MYCLGVCVCVPVRGACEHGRDDSHFLLKNRLFQKYTKMFVACGGPSDVYQRLNARSGVPSTSVIGLQKSRRIYYIGACVGGSAHGAGASSPWVVDAGWIGARRSRRLPGPEPLVRLLAGPSIGLSLTVQKVLAGLRSSQRLRAGSLPDLYTHSLAARRVHPIEMVSHRGAVGQNLPGSPPQLRGWTRFRPECDVLGSCDRG